MKQILHRKAELIVAVLLLFTAAFAQEFEVDGNLKVQGDIIFSDASTMTSASSGIPAGILVPFAGTTTLQLDVATYGGTADYLTGTGTIATLEFLAKASGEYEIEFSDETTLRKSDNVTISTDELVEGIVNIE